MSREMEAMPQNQMQIETKVPKHFIYGERIIVIRTMKF